MSTAEPKFGEVTIKDMATRKVSASVLDAEPITPQRLAPGRKFLPSSIHVTYHRAPMEDWRVTHVEVTGQRIGPDGQPQRGTSEFAQWGSSYLEVNLRTDIKEQWIIEFVEAHWPEGDR